MAEVVLPSRTAAPHRLAENLQKPQLDNRTYRVIELPNKLEVLLIHDGETDKASAAMDVNVGSFSDSDDLPGMAHAVEHLLFMGTKKYPVENEYSSYLQKYGGYSNAFTASCDTNYYFEVSATAGTSSQATTSEQSPMQDPARSPLYGALDRFAQFFVQPLFLEDSLDRELKAVDSENKKNLQSDMWRLHQLGKSLANKEHPYQKFSTGNYKVLHDDPIARGVEIREAFMDFYKKQYSANRMKLAVLGRESLDELEGWVVQLFSDVPNQDLPKLRWDGLPLLSASEVKKQIFAKPVMDSRSLDIEFVYPDEEEQWESHPGRYLSHLIGHEGPGSILAYIKGRGWANGLGAGPYNVCPGGGLFSVSIRLTEDGLKHYKEVIKVFFQYIALVREQPPFKWIVEEMQQLAEVDFRFKQQIPASRTTSMLSGVMQKPYPRDKLLSANSLIWKYDEAAIKRGLDSLTPDNFRYTVVAQDFPGDWDQKERWYGTEYKYESIPEDFLAEIESAYASDAKSRPSELYLPGKNDFIPERLDVEKRDVTTPAVAPKLIRNDESVRTWWKKDDQFWAPKANVNVVLRSNVPISSALTFTMTALLKSLVEDSLVEYVYDADLAGLSYEIGNHAKGLDVSVSGYNDKMHVLLEKVLKAVKELEVKDDRFKIVKDRLMRGYKNFDYQQPYQQIGSYSRWLTSELGYINYQLLDELPSITDEQLRRFVPQFLSQLHIEVLVHGNVDREDALKMSDIVENTIQTRPLPYPQWPFRRSLLIPPGGNYVYKSQLRDPENVNHCIDYLLFTHLNNDRVARSKMLLLAEMIHEPCFDTLRTKEQLGYVVSSSMLSLQMVSGLRILIQSERDPVYLDQRIELFLTKFGETLRDMSAEDFDAYKAALVNKRLEKLKNLNMETARFWHHITSEKFDFELVYRDVENVKDLTKEQVMEFFQEFIAPSSTKRAKLAVHLEAQAQAKGEKPTPDVSSAAEEEQAGPGALENTTESKQETQTASAAPKPIVIEDVRAFKAGLGVSPGPVPVKPLREFEDREAKL